MNRIINAVKEIGKQILRYYKQCMIQYGDGLLRGGSYGCA